MLLSYENYIILVRNLMARSTRFASQMYIPFHPCTRHITANCRLVFVAKRVNVHIKRFSYRPPSKGFFLLSVLLLMRVKEAFAGPFSIHG